MMWHLDPKTSRLVPGPGDPMPTYDIPDDLQSQPQTRAQLVARMRKLRQDIDDIFSDAEHWNRIHPNEEPIDPDPDGLMGKIAAALDTALADEDGPI